MGAAEAGVPVGREEAERPASEQRREAEGEATGALAESRRAASAGHSAGGGTDGMMLAVRVRRAFDRRCLSNRRTTTIAIANGISR